ncbi:MAG: crossover junction endodeoxyribonuclease RuvC, partial [Ignavibacteria bacterium]
MIILGIDPGTLKTGYGIIELTNGRVKLLSSGVIENNRIKSLPLRLKFIYDEITRLIEEFLPDELSIESAFYGKNVQSALKIGHARGVSILAAVNKQIPAYEYTPREIKKSIVGNGAASKQQVSYMVHQLLQLKR